ncbi:MAG: lysylphosphatidylglycerol synthase domain-containing protein [Gemmatimonadales bacterium]
MTRRTLLRVALSTVALVAVALAVRDLLRQWDQLTVQPIVWHLRPGALALAVIAALGTYLVLIDSWRRVLAGYDHTLPFPVAARVWILSNFGKYLPGKLWIIAGMAVMAKEVGVRPTAAVTSAVIMQALALASGAAVGAFAPGALAALGPWGAWGATAVAVASVVGLAFLMSTRAMGLLQSLLPAGAPQLEPVRGSALLIGLLGNVIAWLGYGLASRWLAAGLFDVPALPVLAASGAFAVSYLAGLLALVVPGGIGVRETIFIVLLRPYIGLPSAVALAIASRLLMTLIELSLALPAALQRRRAGDPAPPTTL